MPDKNQDLSFRDIFVPLTDKKVITFFIIVGLLVHYHILFNGFVWDDLTYIVGNPEIENFNLVTLVGPNMFNSSGYFRPLPAMYFSLLHNLFGQAAYYYHFIQLGLHITCTVLLYFIFKKFFSLANSFWLSLVFLIHPINVESVAYIGATQSQLYFLFGGLAFYHSLKDSLSSKRSVFIHLFLLLALFTKEVSFLYLLIIYFYRWLNKKPIPRPFFGLTLSTLTVYLIVRFMVLGTVLQKMHLIPISEISFWQRLAHIPSVLFYYLKTFFFPGKLVIDQIWLISGINWSTFYFPLITVLFFAGVLLLILIRFFRTKNPHIKNYLLFLVWFVLGISMLMQVFPLDMTVADRWFYFPEVGLLGLFGILLNSIKLKKIHYPILALILVVLSIRTMARNADWFSTITLYGHDVKYYDNYDIENYLGADLAFAGRFTEALPHFLKSTELLPHDTNLFNVGSVYELLKDYPKARDYYQQALSVKHKYFNHSQVQMLAAEGLSRTMFRLNSPRESREEILKHLSTFPQNGSLWGYLAISEYLLQNYEAAASAAAKAKTYLPNPTTDKLYQMITQKQDLTPLLK